MLKRRKGFLVGACLLGLGGCTTPPAAPTAADVAVAHQKSLDAARHPYATLPGRVVERGSKLLALPATMQFQDCDARDVECHARFARTALREKHCKELMLRYGIDLTGMSLGETKPDGTREADRKLLKACVYNQQHFPGTSTLGVALSGGGPRSASFSMGVLKALHQLDYLDRVETISSVSGGGYTSFWYFMQQYQALLREAREKSPDSDIARADGYGDILAGLETLEREALVVRAEGLLRPEKLGFSVLASGLDRPGIEPELKIEADRAARFCEQVEDYQTGAERPSLVSRMFEARTDRAIIHNDYRYQHHLGEQSDIINYSQYSLVQSLETSGLVVAHGATLPVYWVTDGVLNTHLFNGSPLSNAYRKGLERTYGLALNDQYQDYIDYFDRKPRQFLNGRNGQFLFWRPNARIEPVTFADMRQFLQAYNLCASRSVWLRPMPMPIINTKETLPENLRQKLLGDEPASLGLAQGVFSFSPLSWGSVAVRFQDDGVSEAPVTVSKAVAISGAAADRGARELEGLMGGVMSVANTNLGYNIRRPARSRMEPLLQLIDTVLGGFPLKYVTPDSWRTTIRLSDGGHAENLGVYPLVERQTRYMVVVDAEHDDGYVFDALNRVLAKLRAQAEPGDGVTCSICPNAGDLLEGKSPSVFDLRVTRSKSDQPIDIAYVKLSLPLPEMMDGQQQAQCSPSLARVREQAMERLQALREEGAGAAPAVQLPCSVWHYYLSERNKQNNAFPHNSTADIWYDSLQYEAYRDLGYYLGMTELADLLASWRADIAHRQQEEEDVVQRYRAAIDAGLL